jgi:O-antigen/teichoic acid export membrane protein
MNDRRSGHIVLRNTLYLTISQVLAVPLSIVTNALAAHYLGPEAFGYAYLAGTLCAFGFLLVGWGHEAVLPATVAKDHSLSGVMLGSSMVWRVATSVLVYGVLAGWCYLLRYPAEVQWALALTTLLSVGNTLVAGCKDTIRGLERTDIPSYAHLGQHLLGTVLVAIVLALGGRLRAALLAQAVAAAVVLVAIWRTLKPIGVTRLSVDWRAVRQLFAAGTPFMALGLAMALQPNIDAVFLSKLAPAEVMGWYAVSRRLIGALLLPATALIGALYPTLCRLHATDEGEFRRASSNSFQTVTFIVVPIALSCAMFADIGVALFSRELFHPAEDNLRVSAAFLALMYFSLPLGTCIMAAGRQRAWSVVQCLCVLVSLVLDPLLIPIFQSRYGNGGLGLSVASVLSEALMIACGVWLAPSGLFDRKFARQLGTAAVAGGALVVTALAARPLSSYLAAPLALTAYAAVLWGIGGINRTQLAVLRAALRGRASEATVTSPS